MTLSFKLSRDRYGILLEQRHKEDAPEFPIVVLTLKSEADSPQRIAVEYDVPTTFPFDDLYLARDWGEQYWRIDDQRGFLRYKRTLAPDEQVRTILGFEDISLSERRSMLEQGPEIHPLEIDDADMSMDPEQDATGSVNNANNNLDEESRTEEIEPQLEAKIPEVDATTPDEIVSETSIESETTADSPTDSSVSPSRIEAIEADVESIAAYESELLRVFGDPSDPLETGELGGFKEDLEVVVELVSDLREDVNKREDEQLDAVSQDVDELKEELETLVSRVDRCESSIDDIRDKFEDQITSVEDRLSAVEESQRRFYQQIEDRIADVEAVDDTVEDAQ